MGKIKAGIWILILIFLVLLFFQNQSVFLSAQSFQLNLYFVKYQTPALPGGIFFLAVFIIGLLISYLFSLGDRFKAKRALKSLSTTLDARQQEVTQLKKEIEELKRVRPPEPVAPVEQPPSSIEKSAEEGPIELPAGEDTLTEPEKADEMSDAEEKKGVES